MAVLTWIILGLLVAGAAVFVFLPLHTRRFIARRDEERTSAAADKEAALQLLRELEQDRQTGKIEEDEFAEQHAAAEAAAIVAMKRLDALGGGGDADSVEQMIRVERNRLQKESRG